MAQYVIKNTTTGKYVNVVEWDGGAGWAPPTGCTASVATPATQAQASADIAAQAAADIAAAQSALRDAATNFILNDPSPTMKTVRALALVVLDEINRLRTQPTTTFTAYTAGQLLSAVVAKITSGSAD